MTTGYISLLTLLMFSLSCNNKARPNADNVFTNITYDKVIAYDYDGGGDIEIIDKNGNLANGINKSVELKSSQIIEITNLLCSKSTYGEDIAMCFNPRFGIVFYDGDHVSAYISICLECNYLISSIRIPANRSGFTTSGSNGIVSFQKKIGFTY